MSNPEKNGIIGNDVRYGRYELQPLRTLSGFSGQEGRLIPSPSEPAKARPELDIPNVIDTRQGDEPLAAQRPSDGYNLPSDAMYDLEGLGSQINLPPQALTPRQKNGPKS